MGKSGFGALLSYDLILHQLSQPQGFHHCFGIEYFNLISDCILHTTNKKTHVECIKQSFCVISQFLKLCLILSHNVTLVKFSEFSHEVIKISRAKLLQKELEKIYPVWLFMSLDLLTEPLKGFMFQMKGCKQEFVDIKSVMQTKILFCHVYPSNHIITIEARKIKFRPTKIVGRREPNFCRRLQLSSIVHA